MLVFHMTEETRMESQANSLHFLAGGENDSEENKNLILHHKGRNITLPEGFVKI